MANAVNTMASGIKLTTKEEFTAKVMQEHRDALEKGVTFQPRPLYCPKDDCLIFFMRDELTRRKRINSLLTLYLSAKDNSLVGCEVKSIKGMLRLKGAFGVLVTDHKMKLGVFLAFALMPTLEEREPDKDMERYEEELETYKDVEIEDDMLACAAS